MPTLGELIAMRVASAVAYRLSIKGGGRSFLAETGYRGALGSAGRLVRLSREAPPRAVELPAGLVLPLTYAILGVLSQGPCCQVGGRRHGKARTDSTYVLAAVRDLTRLELITEAVRAGLEELAREDPGMLDGLTGRDWATCYGRPVRLGGQPSRPAARLEQAGQDTYLLLTMLERNQRQGGPDSDGLRRIFLQNFLIAGGKVRPRTGEDGLPPASLRIISPTICRPASRCAAIPAGPGT